MALYIYSWVKLIAIENSSVTCIACSTTDDWLHLPVSSTEAISLTEACLFATKEIIEKNKIITLL